MAGNKGAVGIRLDLDDSTLCFVTAHYAAGHSAYEQRNLDYATIANGLHFKRGKKIQQHEKVIYFGDLNYRIAMPNDVVREMAVGDDYASLIEGDQVCLKTTSDGQCEAAADVPPSLHSSRTTCARKPSSPVIRKAH